MRKLQSLLLTGILMLGVSAAANAQPPQVVCDNIPQACQSDSGNSESGASNSGNGNANTGGPGNSNSASENNPCAIMRGRAKRECEVTFPGNNDSTGSSEISDSSGSTESSDSSDSSDSSEPEAAAATPAGSYCSVFYAGQTIAVGSVCITLTGDALLLDYLMEDGWTLSSAHAWAGDSLSSAPRTGDGNPIPGLFPYSASPENAESLRFTMALSDLSLDPDTLCKNDLLVAAHGVVNKPGESNESAWAGETRFTNRGNWATYFGIDCDQLVDDGDIGTDPDPDQPQACYFAEPAEAWAGESNGWWQIKTRTASRASDLLVMEEDGSVSDDPIAGAAATVVFQDPGSFDYEIQLSPNDGDYIVQITILVLGEPDEAIHFITPDSGDTPKYLSGTVNYIDDSDSTIEFASEIQICNTDEEIQS